jgi:flagellar export protein FliJ
MALSPDRLELLQRVADRGEDESRRAFAVARQYFEQQQQMQQDLQGYLEEYQQISTTTVSAALLENRRLFVARLRQAVDSQARQVESALATLQQAEARWLESRRALRIAEQMLDTGRRQALIGEERQAQRRQDDETLQRRAVAERGA